MSCPPVYPAEGDQGAGTFEAHLTRRVGCERAIEPGRRFVRPVLGPRDESQAAGRDNQ